MRQKNGEKIQKRVKIHKIKRIKKWKLLVLWFCVTVEKEK